MSRVPRLLLAMPSFSLLIGLMVTVFLHFAPIQGLSVDELVAANKEIMLGFSFAVLLLPTATVPLVADLVMRTSKLGVRFNPKLFNDYIDGSFVSAFYALVTLIFVMIFSITKWVIAAYIAVTSFASVVVTLLLLLVGLHGLARSVYQALFAEGLQG